MQNFINHLKEFKHIPFSIIVPCYKVKNYIEECLDSIQNQTYFIRNNDYEILCGVDGDKETLDKINEIKHKYKNIRIFYGKNKGLGITRNTLINYSKYENIITFDSDDIMCYNLVECIANKINLNYNIQIMRFKRLYNIIDNELKGKSVTYFYLKNNFPNNIFNRKPDHHIYALLFFKKELWKKVGGYWDKSCAEDYDLLERMKCFCEKENYVLIDDRLMFRRVRDNSITKQQNWKTQNKIMCDYVNKKIKNGNVIYKKILVNETMKEMV